MMHLSVLTAFGSQGFDTTPQFRNGWIALLLRGRATSGGFRADFCRGRHLLVRVNGVDKQFAVVRGFPVEYAHAVSGKILLRSIGSPAVVGRLVRAGRRTDAPVPCPKPPLRWRSPRSFGVTVHFSPPGSALVRVSEQQKLYRWYVDLPSAVRARVRRGELGVAVEGFTSTTQPARANTRLSLRRAVNVRNALMAVIGPGARYLPYAHGESRARTRDDVEDPRERRVRVSVTEGPGT